jgi:hypothetical protein
MESGELTTRQALSRHLSVQSVSDLSLYEEHSVIIQRLCDALLQLLCDHLHPHRHHHRYHHPQNGLMKSRGTPSTLRWLDPLSPLLLHPLLLHRQLPLPPRKRVQS